MIYTTDNFALLFLRFFFDSSTRRHTTFTPSFNIREYIARGSSTTSSLSSILRRIDILSLTIPSLFKQCSELTTRCFCHLFDIVPPTALDPLSPRIPAAVHSTGEFSDRPTLEPQPSARILFSTFWIWV